jgi:selenocysteine lyase/cysteine desulfurase
MNYPLEEIRREFPLTKECTYLNAASEAPAPLRALRVMREILERRKNPSRFKVAEYFDIPRRAREAAARLLGVSSETVSLTSSTGYGVNMAAQGLALKPGDEILLVEGQFPANVYPWLHAARAAAATVRFVPAPSDALSAGAFEPLTTPRTRVLAFDWVQFSTGVRADTEGIIAMARRRSVFTVVDAAQGLGALAWQGPLPDVLAAPGHKWLLSPIGTGVLYVSDEARKRLRPPLAGWRAFLKEDSFGDLTHYDYALPFDGRAFEVGSPPIDHFAAFASSLEYLQSVGVPAIEAHVKQIVEPLLERLQEAGFKVYGAEDSEKRSAIVSFERQGEDLQPLYRRLLGAGVVCAFREGRIRLAPHLFNGEDDMARTMDVLFREAAAP